MDSPAAIRGTFSDFRLIKGRKCAQIICEIPIEEADTALSVLGGIPQPASERWIALAPLNVTSIKPQKERQRWEDLKAAAQASIRCGEPAFQKYMAELGYVVDGEDDAAGVVRELCNVDSRRQLNLDPKAAAKWRELDTKFKLWLREPQHA